MPQGRHKTKDDGAHSKQMPKPTILLTWVSRAAINLTQANKCFQQGTKPQEVWTVKHRDGSHNTTSRHQLKTDLSIILWLSSSNSRPHSPLSLSSPASPR